MTSIPEHTHTWKGLAARWLCHIVMQVNQQAPAIYKSTWNESIICGILEVEMEGYSE